MIAKFKKSKRLSWKSLIFLIFLGSLALTVLGFIVVSNFKINQRRAQLNSQAEQLKKEIQILETKQYELKARLSQTQEEEYLEEEARERFNLKKPGEEVVAILPPENEGEESKDRGFLQEIWEKIKNLSRD